MVGVRSFCFFFFQAEDGIRDKLVTGVQTCALPISDKHIPLRIWWALEKKITSDADLVLSWLEKDDVWQVPVFAEQIGRASCRERVWILVVAVLLDKKRAISIDIMRVSSRVTRLA